MGQEEIKKQLEEVEHDLFYVNMIDHWTTGDRERWSQLFDRKLELEKMLAD